MTICRVHDADDVVPGRICGRPLPCRDHQNTHADDRQRVVAQPRTSTREGTPPKPGVTAGETALSPRYVITARKPGKIVRLTRTGVAAAFTCVERLRELGYRVYVVRTADEAMS